MWGSWRGLSRVATRAQSDAVRENLATPMPMSQSDYHPIHIARRASRYVLSAAFSCSLGCRCVTPSKRGAGSDLCR